MKQKKLLRALQFGSLVVLITGIIPFFAVFEATQEPWRLFFDVLSWPLDQVPDTFSPRERQLSAVLGGVLCGWAWLLYRLARTGVFNPTIRKIMVQSVLIWFVVDSSGSILSGIPLNAIGNLGFLLVLLIPLRLLKQ